MTQVFSTYEIIDKKKRAQDLSTEEIKWFIDGYLKKTIPDYQMSAFLMAVYFQGMSVTELAALTDSMLYSGKTINFTDPTVVDKHSTGGIGDKASFILAPIAAAAGVKIPMVAGRSLGFTGGTIDKIEAIKGFKTQMPLDEFKNMVTKRGLVLIGQTEEIAPADKLIYALRDVTATIDSIPLITASIMSKKLAEGARGIVMDIKVGHGAFMKKIKDARALAKSIIATAKRFDRKCTAIISDMNQPLGFAVGNSLEIIESIETLKGRGPADLELLSVELAGQMIYLGGIAKTPAEGIKKAQAVLKSGKALEKFREMIKNQGGDERVIGNYDLLPLAKVKTDVLSEKSGYVQSFENQAIGQYLNEIGGGRKVKTDKIDFGVGFYFHKKVGDPVKKGEKLLTIYHNENQKAQIQDLKKIFTKEIIKVSAKKVKALKVIIEKIGK
ncbi:MAG: thymidine phosphorylase [Bacteriovoracaceae bacterium]|nr:thymidine phosphorylase [Bacteriovoracaceae bacterium]